jgi:hypothetical protein
MLPRVGPIPVRARAAVHLYHTPHERPYRRVCTPLSVRPVCPYARQAIHEVCVFVTVRVLPLPHVPPERSLLVRRVAPALPSFYQASRRAHRPTAHPVHVSSPVGARHGLCEWPAHHSARPSSFALLAGLHNSRVGCPAPCQVVARYGYLDRVDHGPDFVARVAEALAALAAGWGAGCESEVGAGWRESFHSHHKDDPDGLPRGHRGSKEQEVQGRTRPGELTKPPLAARMSPWLGLCSSARSQGRKPVPSLCRATLQADEEAGELGAVVVSRASQTGTPAASHDPPRRSLQLPLGLKPQVRRLDPCSSSSPLPRLCSC